MAEIVKKGISPFFETDYPVQRMTEAFGRLYVPVPDRRLTTVRQLRGWNNESGTADTSMYQVPVGIFAPTEALTVDAQYEWDWWATISLFVRGTFAPTATFKVKFVASEQWVGGEDTTYTLTEIAADTDLYRTARAIRDALETALGTATHFTVDVDGPLVHILGAKGVKLTLDTDETGEEGATAMDLDATYGETDMDLADGKPNEITVKLKGEALNAGTLSFTINGPGYTNRTSDSTDLLKETWALCNSDDNGYPIQNNTVGTIRWWAPDLDGTFASDGSGVSSGWILGGDSKWEMNGYYRTLNYRETDTPGENFISPFRLEDTGWEPAISSVAGQPYQVIYEVDGSHTPAYVRAWIGNSPGKVVRNTNEDKAPIDVEDTIVATETGANLRFECWYDRSNGRGYIGCGSFDDHDKGGEDPKRPMGTGREFGRFVYGYAVTRLQDSAAKYDMIEVDYDFSSGDTAAEIATGILADIEAEDVYSRASYTVERDGGSLKITASIQNGSLQQPIRVDDFVLTGQTDHLGGEGAFSGTITGWTDGAGWTLNAATDTADYSTTASSLTHDDAVVAERYYEVKFTISEKAGTASVTPSVGGVAGTAVSADGSYSETILTTGTGALTFAATGTGSFSIAAITLYDKSEYLNYEVTEGRYADGMENTQEVRFAYQFFSSARGVWSELSPWTRLYEVSGYKMLLSGFEAPRQGLNADYIGNAFDVDQIWLYARFSTSGGYCDTSTMVLNRSTASAAADFATARMLFDMAEDMLVQGTPAPAVGIHTPFPAVTVLTRLAQRLYGTGQLPKRTGSALFPIRNYTDAAPYGVVNEDGDPVWPSGTTLAITSGQRYRVDEDDLITARAKCEISGCFIDDSFIGYDLYVNDRRAGQVWDIAPSTTPARDAILPYEMTPPYSSTFYLDGDWKGENITAESDFYFVGYPKRIFYSGWDQEQSVDGMAIVRPESAHPGHYFDVEDEVVDLQAIGDMLYALCKPGSIYLVVGGNVLGTPTDLQKRRMESVVGQIAPQSALALPNARLQFVSQDGIYRVSTAGIEEDQSNVRRLFMGEDSTEGITSASRAKIKAALMRGEDSPVVVMAGFQRDTYGAERQGWLTSDLHNGGVFEHDNVEVTSNILGDDVGIYPPLAGDSLGRVKNLLDPDVDTDLDADATATAAAGFTCRWQSQPYSFDGASKTVARARVVLNRRADQDLKIFVRAGEDLGDAIPAAYGAAAALDVGPLGWQSGLSGEPGWIEYGSVPYEASEFWIPLPRGRGRHMIFELRWTSDTGPYEISKVEVYGT